MKPRLAIATLGCAVLVTIVPTRGAEKRFMTESDLLKFTWIADPQISPDGSSVAFVRVTVNEKENRYETSLFIVPTSGSESPRRLSANIRDTAPRWSPDGRQLAFVRSVTKQTNDGEIAGKSAPQPGRVALRARDGGEAGPLTGLRRGAGARVGSPDGKPLAFSAPAKEKGGRDGQDRRDRQNGGVGRDGKDGKDQKS